MVGVAYTGGTTYKSKKFLNSTTAILPVSNNLIILIWQLSNFIFGNSLLLLLSLFFNVHNFYLLLYASLIKSAVIFPFAMQMTFMSENSQKED